MSLTGGASAQAPENTIAAFKLAEQQHADMSELDIRETKDHQLVVMHDKTLTRTTNVARVFPDRAPWRVGDLTLAEIQKLDAGSWFARRYSGERVPTLAETLRAMDGSRIGLLLEIKSPRLSPGIEARVARELRQNPSWLRPGRLVVQLVELLIQLVYKIQCAGGEEGRGRAQRRVPAGAGQERDLGEARDGGAGAAGGDRSQGPVSRGR
ncbi:glycerophosphodiester phosphodiesterase family protein [Sphaerisporangium viridialbum]|uniref:glycerophosphodiester phosphodiesterase family protein n=1 Tax=Sphaerisporangium viridialbum TaxID=46189 RepID=UPI003C7433B7